jgi:hypothetical protein
MAYEAQCPKGHRLQVTEAHFRQTVNCPTCNTPFVVPDLSAAAHPAAAIVTDEPVFTPKRRKVSLGNWSEVSATFGRPMMAVGLVLVLFSRGCDVIGERGVEKARANLASATLEATAGFDKAIRKYDQTIKKLEKAEKPDSTAIDDAKKSRKNQVEKRDEALEKFQTETLPDLQYSASVAASSNVWWAYWREWVFVISAIVLTIGLMAVSSIAQGAERLVCLIMLAIITFSIFIGGIAWIAGARSSGPPIPMTKDFGGSPATGGSVQPVGEDLLLETADFGRPT